MNHNTLNTAPERDEWGTLKGETASDDWSEAAATPETSVESAQRRGLVKRVGEKVAPKFFEGRDLRKGYAQLEKIRAAKFRPLDQKPAFKHGSKESMLVGVEEYDDWNDAHAMNRAYDAAKRVDEVEKELASRQQNLAETRKSPVHSDTLEELDAGQVASAEWSLATAKRIAQDANERAWSTDELRRSGRDYTEEQLGLRPASSEQDDSEEW